MAHRRIHAYNPRTACSRKGAIVAQNTRIVEGDQPEGHVLVAPYRFRTCDLDSVLNRVRDVSNTSIAKPTAHAGHCNGQDRCQDGKGHDEFDKRKAALA